MKKFFFIFLVGVSVALHSVYTMEAMGKNTDGIKIKTEENSSVLSVTFSHNISCEKIHLFFYKSDLDSTAPQQGHSSQITKANFSGVKTLKSESFDWFKAIIHHKRLQSLKELYIDSINLGTQIQ